MSGEKGVVNLDTMPPVDNEDEDLSKADRGDELPPDDEGDPEKKPDPKKDPAKKEGAERDADGRFKKKEGDGEGEDEDDEDDEGDEEDDEDEDDEEDEGDPDPDKKPDPEKDKANLPIRLRKAQTQRDEARTEAAALTQQLQEARDRLAAVESAAKKHAEPKEDPAKKINEEQERLYEEVEELRADAQSKEAAKIQRKIDENNRTLARMESEAIARKAAVQVAEVTHFNAMLDVAEAAISDINPNHEDFDPKKVKRFERLIGAYEKDGMSPTEALKEAAETMFGVDPFSKKGAKKDPPAKKYPAKKQDPDKKPDPKKAIDTQKKQPPDAGERGQHRDSTKIDINRLTDDEFDKLPDSKKAELRGDFI